VCSTGAAADPALVVDVKSCDRGTSWAAQELPLVKASGLGSGLIRHVSERHACTPGVPEATGTHVPRDPAQNVLFHVEQVAELTDCGCPRTGAEA
jgi:hypothetical protein